MQVMRYEGEWLIFPDEWTDLEMRAYFDESALERVAEAGGDTAPCLLQGAGEPSDSDFQRAQKNLDTLISRSRGMRAVEKNENGRAIGRPVVG